MGEQVVIAVVTGVCGLLGGGAASALVTNDVVKPLRDQFDSIPSRYYLRNCSLTKD